MVPVLHNRARMTLPEDHRNRRNDQGQDEGKKQRAGYILLLSQTRIPWKFSA